MILLGIGTQTHVINVGLHLSPSRYQLLYKRPAPECIQNFVHQFLNECYGVGYPTMHNLSFKYTTLRGYKCQQLLSCSGFSSTCQKPLRLFILVLYLHLATRSRVLSMLGILPEWLWRFLLTSS